MSEEKEKETKIERRISRTIKAVPVTDAERPITALNNFLVHQLQVGEVLTEKSVLTPEEYKSTKSNIKNGDIISEAVNDLQEIHYVKVTISEYKTVHAFYKTKRFAEERAGRTMLIHIARNRADFDEFISKTIIQRMT